MVSVPTFDEEKELWSQGYLRVAGVDEAGRGPLAGPVVAAAVVLHRNSRASWLREIRDSKQLRAEKRESLLKLIQRGAEAGIGISSNEIIDAEGMTNAIRLAAKRALESLKEPPQYVLIDGYALKDFPYPQTGIIDGDQFSISIAAASIVAKVTRDAIMLQMDALYPGYGFAQHKGYGTAEHLECLQRLGPCPIHRRSFSPLRERLL
ncbi:MAG: ribonuclease HII [Chloroflexi bacterium]|nr:ribonuclease HII [Chloroflexota bacterium]